MTAITAKQLELMRHAASAHALDIADRIGILREPQRWDLPEISNTTWLTITDGWFIAMLGMLGVCLAAVTIAYALWAEHRDEDSLYLSVGFICACTAIFVLHPVTGILVAWAGAACILGIRRRSRRAHGKKPDAPRG